MLLETFLSRLGFAYFDSQHRRFPTVADFNGNDHGVLLVHLAMLDTGTLIRGRVRRPLVKASEHMIDEPLDPVVRLVDAADLLDAVKVEREKISETVAKAGEAAHVRCVTRAIVAPGPSQVRQGPCWAPKQTVDLR